jgi:hypothetical protein
MVSVEALPLDQYCADHGIEPTLIKIDAESAEWDVLQGMADLLTAVRPIICLEVGDFDLDQVKASAELVEYLMNLNYSAFEYCNMREPLRPHLVRDRYDYGNLVFIAKS